MEGRDVHAARFVGGRRSGKSSAPRSVLLKIRLSLRFALTLLRIGNARSPQNAKRAQSTTRRYTYKLASLLQLYS